MACVMQIRTVTFGVSWLCGCVSARSGGLVTYLTAKEIVLCVLSVASSVAVAFAVGSCAVGKAVIAVAGVGGRHFVWIGRSWALAMWMIVRAIKRCSDAALGGFKVQKCELGLRVGRGVRCLVCSVGEGFVRQEPVVAVLV